MPPSPDCSAGLRVGPPSPLPPGPAQPTNRILCCDFWQPLPTTTNICFRVGTCGLEDSPTSSHGSCPLSKNALVQGLR